VDILLGLDLGTTNIKALAIGSDGHPVAGVSAPTPESNGEYDAEALWGVSARLIREVGEKIPGEHHVAALAVASMGEAGVLLDADGQPLAPIIPWYDKRTLAALDWWRAHISEADLYRITGLSLRHIYSACKLLWYCDNAPQSFSRALTWLCLADWITFRLTGVRSMSYSIACRTMLFDVRQRAWSAELLCLTNLPARLFPSVFPSGQVVGAVTRDAAYATGLREGTPIVVGGHDHICAALAAGVVEPGRVLDSSGTVEAIMVPLTQPVLDPARTGGMSCGCHTMRDRYYLIGGMMSGGVVDWLGRMLGGNDSPQSIARLMEEAAASPLGANGLWFEPYLDGAASRPRDPEAWGAWLGLRLHHTRADLLRAAMEGLSFGIRYLSEGIQQATQSPIHELRAVGGGTRNAWWQQLKADVLGVPIETPAVSDVTAQGAALLAGIGIGLFANEADAIACAYRPAIRYHVDDEKHARYNAAYRAYCALYPALKTVSLKAG